MSVSRLLCLTAGLTLWRVLCVAGVFLLVLLPPAPPPPTSLQQRRRCDHRLSSIARRIVHQTLMPVVTSFKPDIKLPYQCPLHPVRDVHGKAELAKLNYRVNLWTCAKCGKSFTGEVDLETHIHLRHPELSDAGDFSVCLADYCDILRCDPQRDRVLRRPWPVRQPDSPVSSSQLVRAPSRELVALLENTETGLVMLDPEVSGHSCGGQCLDSLGPARPRLRRSAISDNNMTASGGRQRGQGTGGCNPAAMERLRGRCELLVDTCISPLALSLTDKELAELRDKMEAEVCAFLSCDLYWSLDRGGRGLNIGLLLLTTITAAVLYLMFVYHLVWVWY